MSAPSITRPPWWAVVSSAVAIVALVGGWLIAGAVQPPGYDPVRQTISVLSRHGAAHRWIMTAGLYTVGICHLVTAAGLRGAPRIARLVLACGGLAGIGLTIFSQPPRGTSTAHIAFAAVAFIVLAVFPVVVAGLIDVRRRTRFPLRRGDIAVAAVVSAGLLAWLVQAMDRGTLGLAERFLTAQQTAWPLLVVLALRRNARVDQRSSAPAAPNTETLAPMRTTDERSGAATDETGS